MKREILSTLFPVVKHEIVEVVVEAGSTKNRYNLPDLQNLRNVKLRNVEVYTSSNVSVTPTGNPVVSPAELKKSYITLQGYNGKEFLHEEPLPALHYIFDADSNTELLQKEFTNQRVNYPKSYIEYFLSAPVPATFSFLLSVYYVDLTQAEMNEANTFNNKS
jgi:hypothetical protein